MLVKNIIDEDFVNYKKASMFIATYFCTWKCCKELNLDISICQNSIIAQQPTIDISNEKIINRYINNPITHAIVFGGLEPFDQFPQLFMFIKEFRKVSNDDIVIYTGFNKDEIKDKIDILSKYPNIIIKFGRYIPNQEKHFDEVLGIYLASDNQYTERIS